MAYQLWPAGFIFEDAGHNINGFPSFVATSTTNKFPFQRGNEYRLFSMKGRWIVGQNAPEGDVLIHVRGDYDDCYAPPENVMMKWGACVREEVGYTDARFRLFSTPAYSKWRHWAPYKHRYATPKTKQMVETVLLCATRLRHKNWNLPTEMWLKILGFIPTRLGRALSV